MQFRLVISRCIIRNKRINDVNRRFMSSQSTCSQDDRYTHQERQRRVVVTGLGAITPLGYDIKSTWEGVLLQTNNDMLQSPNDTVGITTLYNALQQQNLSDAQFDKEWELLKDLPCQVAAAVRNDWIKNHPRYASSETKPMWLDGRTSRFIQLALISANEAITSSGLDEWLGNNDTQTTSQSTIELESRREEYGVSIGNGMSSCRDISISSTKSLRKLSPHFVPQILPNSPSSRISIHNNLLGPNLSHSEACAASAVAITQAVELIQSGKVKGMVAGGCESSIDALGLGGFSKLRALSTSHDESSSRPFDSNRDGFVLAEGAAMMVLEEYEHAMARGAPIIAEVLGVGYSGDAYHITSPERAGKGAARSMQNACLDANRSMKNVDYINTHATSTPAGDVAEMTAIRLALDRCSSEKTDHPPLLVSSTKGATGHLLGAAGALEGCLTVLSLSEDIVPHTQNLETVCDYISQLLSRPNHGTRSIHLVKDKPMLRADLTVTNESSGIKRTRLNTAMSNSFGFGGTNVSILFGRANESDDLLDEIIYTDGS